MVQRAAAANGGDWFELEDISQVMDALHDALPPGSFIPLCRDVVRRQLQSGLLNTLLLTALRLHRNAGLVALRFYPQAWALSTRDCGGFLYEPGGTPQRACTLVLVGFPRHCTGLLALWQAQAAAMEAVAGAMGADVTVRMLPEPDHGRAVFEVCVPPAAS